MLRVSANLIYIYVKCLRGAVSHWTGANAASVGSLNVDELETAQKCCVCQLILCRFKRTVGLVQVTNSWTSANAVPVSGFPVHPRGTVAGCKEQLQMLRLSADFMYIYVIRWLGAGSSWTSANAVPVSGFPVHLRVTVAGCREQLQMLRLSADFMYIDVKRWLGAGNSWTSANAVPVSGVRVCHSNLRTGTALFALHCVAPTQGLTQMQTKLAETRSKAKLLTYTMLAFHTDVHEIR
eukprot:s3500_g2.t1